MKEKFTKRSRMLPIKPYGPKSKRSAQVYIQRLQKKKKKKVH